ncbi:MAG: glycosyltransferase family A protein [Candidatus Micrarchaeota archaeon]
MDRMRAASVRFDELARVLKRYGEGRHDGLIIMPSYKAYDYLFRHLELLQKQTFRDFDLLIMLSSESDEKKVSGFLDSMRPGFVVVLAKRNEDTGSAGGFFAGEKYALENGYKYVFLTDDDLLPLDADTIGRLVEERKKGAMLAYSSPHFVVDGERAFTGSGIHFYSLLDISLLKEAGLHFAPMYIGADDTELASRVLKLAGPVSTGCSVSHPGRHSIFADFERSILYRINDMLLIMPGHFVDYIYGSSVLLPAYLVFGSERARKAGFHLMKALIAHKFGKGAIPPKGGGDAAPGSEVYELVVTPLQSVKTGNVFRYGYGKGPAHMLDLAGKALGKKVLLYPINNYAVILSMLLAKETWVSASRGEFLLAKSGNPLLHALRLAVFCFVFPAFLSFGLLSFAINWARKPDTWGYGIRSR